MRRLLVLALSIVWIGAALAAQPTITVTPGTGATINTINPNGQATMANSQPVGIASDQSTLPVQTGPITNPTSVLTRPSSAVSASVTATSATPCVFTWTGNPLTNGQTVILTGTVPTGGNFVSGNAYYVVGVSGNNFSLASTYGGTGLSSTSTGSGLSVALVYLPGQLIANFASGPTTPCVTVTSTPGGFIFSGFRLISNVTSGWQNANLQIDFWSATTTYTNGDGQPYYTNGVNAGAANWLRTATVALTQFADGAVGAGILTGPNQAAIKLSGTSLCWNVQIMSQQNPIASQTFTMIPELINLN